MSTRPSRRTRHAATAAIALLAMPLLAGCNWLGWGANAVAGGQTKKVWHDAQYAGLENHSVAVLVSADDYTLYQFPSAPLETCRAISARIAAEVPGTTLMDPKQANRFQTENSYWSTLPYKDLLAKLGVERIVHVDLVQYTTHEPGNKHVWRGVIVANVMVAAADAPNPNDLVYSNTVKVVFPPDRKLGVLDADEQTIQLGMLTLLGQETGYLFHGHEQVKKKYE